MPTTTYFGLTIYKRKTIGYVKLSHIKQLHLYDFWRESAQPSMMIDLEGDDKGIYLSNWEGFVKRYIVMRKKKY